MAKTDASSWNLASSKDFLPSEDGQAFVNPWQAWGADHHCVEGKGRSPQLRLARAKAVVALTALTTMTSRGSQFGKVARQLTCWLGVDNDMAWREHNMKQRGNVGHNNRMKLNRPTKTCNYKS